MKIISSSELSKHTIIDFFQALGVTRDGDFQRHFSM